MTLQGYTTEELKAELKRRSDLAEILKDCLKGTKLHSLI